VRDSVTGGWETCASRMGPVGSISVSRSSISSGRSYRSSLLSPGNKVQIGQCHAFDLTNLPLLAVYLPHSLKRVRAKVIKELRERDTMKELVDEDLGKSVSHLMSWKKKRRLHAVRDSYQRLNKGCPVLHVATERAHSRKARPDVAVAPQNRAMAATNCCTGHGDECG
jgi:hypothetical protein